MIDIHIFGNGRLVAVKNDIESPVCEGEGQGCAPATGSKNSGFFHDELLTKGF